MNLLNDIVAYDAYVCVFRSDLGGVEWRSLRMGDHRWQQYILTGDCRMYLHAYALCIRES